MTNGNRATGSAPPYVSYKSWDTFIAYLRTNLMPVPDRLDTSVWRQSPFSGSTKSGLQGALTFLGLTDPDGNTLGRLTNLADADTPEASRRILTSIYEERLRPRPGEHRSGPRDTSADTRGVSERRQRKRDGGKGREFFR